MLITFRDCIDNLVDFTGGDSQSAELRVLRRSVREAFNTFYQVYPWRYFQASANIAVSNSTFTERMKYTAATRNMTSAFNVSDATNTTPIVIVFDSDFTLVDNETVSITGALGNTNANGTWVVNKLTDTTAELLGSYGSGVYTADSGNVYRQQLPSWAGEASISIGGGYYNTIERVDDWNVLFGNTHYPRWDTVDSYQMRIRHQDLPADFLKMSFVTDGQQNYMSECYVQPEVWLAAEQTGYWSSTLPFQWTILPHPTTKQQYRLHFNGTSLDDRHISFIYQRRLNDMFRWAGVESVASSISSNQSIDVTAGSKTVVGNSTDFRASMVGGVLRIGATQTADGDEPTGLDGLNAFEEEHIIKSVDSNQAITLETAVTTTGSNLQFVITDLVDIAHEHINAFYRCCEFHYALNSRDSQRIGQQRQEWLMACRLAMESDYKVNFYGGALESGLGYGYRNDTNFGTYISVGP